ncbi:unnamed protein product [Calypogeia fissa]
MDTPRNGKSLEDRVNENFEDVAEPSKRFNSSKTSAGDDVALAPGISSEEVISIPRVMIGNVDIGATMQNLTRAAEADAAAGNAPLEALNVMEKKDLVELITISLSTEGRAKLAELRIVDSLVVLLRRFVKTFHQVDDSQTSDPSSSSSQNDVLDNLLLLLKLMRNLCAGDSTNQDALLENGGVPILTSIASALLSLGSCQTQAQAHFRAQDFDGQKGSIRGKDLMLERITARFGSSTGISSGKQAQTSSSPAVGCLQMMLQLLGNFSQRGEACQVAVWELFFPSVFMELAALRVEDIYGPLCMVLYTCCHDSSKRCWELCQGDGAALVALLVVATMDKNSDDATGKASSSSKQIEWFELLVQNLCLQEPLFPLLFVNLGVPPLKREVDHSKVNTDDLLALCRLCLKNSNLTSVHASLLYTLCDCLNSQVSNDPKSSASADENEQNAGGMPMPWNSMCFMVDILRMAAQGAAGGAEVSPVPSMTSASCTAQILGLVLSIWRMLLASDSTHGDRTEMATRLLSHGLVDLLLSLLEVLGPPEAPGKGDTSGGIPLEDRLSHDSGRFPSKNPYLGYRRDIVAVIANISHRNTLVQDRVREKGSLLVVLQQCVVDKENPFLREWGLWAMRNLLEGNERNQQEIAQLEVKQSVNLPELQKMGLSVQIDPNTGRPRLVNESS